MKQSINSQSIAREKRILQYNKSPNKCCHCSGAIEYDKRHNKYCNHSCAASVTNKSKVKHGNHVEKECSVCSSLTKNTKYCSKKCAGISKIKYYSDEERIRAQRMLGRETYARYSSKKKFQTPVDEDLYAIKQFYLNCPVGYEVDHKVPISRGGLHTLSNLQYLTKSENRSKGSKLNWCPQDDSNA